MECLNSAVCCSSQASSLVDTGKHRCGGGHHGTVVLSSHDGSPFHGVACPLTLSARRQHSAIPTSKQPAVLNCDSLSTFKSRLKTHLFSSSFLLTILPTYLFRQRLCSRLMALWRFINFVLLLLLLLQVSKEND